MRSFISLLPAVASLLATTRAAPACLSEIPCDWELPEDSIVDASATKRALTERGQWAPAQSACWSDNVDQVRALEHSLGSHDDLTPDKCQSLCEAQGFSLAGVEWSRECWCGNTIMGNNQPTYAGNCANACTGDSNQQCGGSDAISIYVKDNYQYTTGPASVLQSYGEYSVTQCWQYVRLPGRPAQEIPGDLMTVQKCVDGCQAAGYSSAALEFGRECTCGNVNYPPGQSTGMYECNMPCNGDGSQICGGRDLKLIYFNPNMTPTNPTNPNTPSGTWAPVPGECWPDSRHARTLEHSLGSFDDLTIEKCVTMCDAQGFNLAGVEYSRECYCGNTIMHIERRLYSNDCVMPCSGDVSQTCGGRDAIQLYVKDGYQYTTGPAMLLESYNGYLANQCWEDSSHTRLLTGSPASAIPGDLMTVQKCIDGCQAAGFDSAGLEFGRECYCGNVSATPGQLKDIYDCVQPCNGDGSKWCGGPNRILLYQKPVTTTIRGIFQVTNTDNGQTLGYISKHPLNGALYRYQPNEVDALHVTFTAAVGATSVTASELTTEDSDITTYPFLGLVRGRDNTNANLSPGSFHYAYISSTNTVPAGSPPQTVGNSYTSVSGLSVPSVSHIWNIDLVTGDTTLTWINPNVAPPVLQYFAQSTALYVGGDVAAFKARYPATIFNIKLNFLPRP